VARVEPSASGVPVAIALGSNLGDRRAHLAFALARLASPVDRLRVSTIRETEPVDVPDGQPPYLNAVVVGRTTLDPLALLKELQAIERAAGRERPFPRAARTLDLDLVLFGDRVIDHPDLEVPHPRYRERAFVLEPLAELAPEWEDPVSGKTVGEMWARMKRPT
jgi:2-amino-4-hydroxy-6-hydroxymethyldihydropteridine diphosphokinase